MIISTALEKADLRIFHLQNSSKENKKYNSTKNNANEKHRK